MAGGSKGPGPRGRVGGSLPPVKGAEPRQAVEPKKGKSRAAKSKRGTRSPVSRGHGDASRFDSATRPSAAGKRLPRPPKTAPARPPRPKAPPFTGNPQSVLPPIATSVAAVPIRRNLASDPSEGGAKVVCRFTLIANCASFTLYGLAKAGVLSAGAVSGLAETLHTAAELGHNDVFRACGYEFYDPDDRALSQPGARQKGAAPGVSRVRLHPDGTGLGALQRGDIVMFDRAHIAIATGEGDEVISLWNLPAYTATKVSVGGLHQAIGARLAAALFAMMDAAVDPAWVPDTQACAEFLSVFGIRDTRPENIAEVLRGLAEDIGYAAGEGAALSDALKGALGEAIRGGSGDLRALYESPVVTVVDAATFEFG